MRAKAPGPLRPGTVPAPDPVEAARGRLFSPLRNRILAQAADALANERIDIAEPLVARVLDKKPDNMSALSTPEEARQFVAETKVDVLAPAVGNMHGMLASMVEGKAEKRLDLGRIAELGKATPAFMTLHGGSGTHDDDFRTAIKNGMSIVHVNTEIRIAWRRGIEAALKAKPNEVTPYKLLADAVAGIKQIVEARLKLFNFI